MTYSIQIISFLFLSLNINKSSINHYSVNAKDTTFIGKTLISWNKATLKSLNRQIDSTNEITDKYVLRKELKSFLKSFKYNQHIHNVDKVDTTSDRYKFIREKINNRNDKKSFCIVEANTSGQMISIRNFIIYDIDKDISEVETYYFLDNKWMKKAGIKRLHFDFSTHLKDNFSKERLGINRHYVIITKFKDNKITESEFFLYGTLSNLSNIKELID